MFVPESNRSVLQPETHLGDSNIWSIKKSAQRARNNRLLIFCFDKSAKNGLFNFDKEREKLTVELCC